MNKVHLKMIANKDDAYRKQQRKAKKVGFNADNASFESTSSVESPDSSDPEGESHNIHNLNKSLTQKLFNEMN